ncbi:unnamed protein product [Rotaria sp. Silwood1]|nr:unnamed protein product [Rotaria sp. Silwood1]
MVIADTYNDRVLQWKTVDMSGQVLVGTHCYGKRLNQLYNPTDVLIDKETDSLIICDSGNRRVLRWSHRSSTTKGEVLLDNIRCWSLAMDDQRYLYVSDVDKHEVRRYQIGDKNGTIVAGGHGKGNGLNQLNRPTYIFVDCKQAVYVSDNENHRVMKWNKDATEGTIVGGGQDKWNPLTRLSFPNGLFVDAWDTLYVADSGNDRIMRWPKGAKEGTIILGGNGWGRRSNQLHNPMKLSFDRYGHLYVADLDNHRIQRFSIE